MRPDSGSSGTGICSRCGSAVSADLFRHPSRPSFVAMTAMNLSDVDELEPLPHVPDRQRYCPACRRRVNLQPTVVLVLFVTSLATMVYCALR